MFERQSALAAALTQGGRDGADGQRQLRIGEARGWSLVQMAAFATTVTEFQDAVRPVIDADLPKQVGAVMEVARGRLLKTGMEQYWLIMPEGDDHSRSLLAAVAPDIGAVTPLSHSRTCIVIEGAAAREVLAKGIAIDFHPDVFGIGQFVLTGLHHTPVLIHRSGENCYELYAMRTFALSVWEWVIDAALPFGYQIVTFGLG